MIPNNNNNDSYISSSSDSTSSSPTSDHLVFFIHGMGQQYEKYGNMKHHVSTMQKNTIDLLSSRYPEQNLKVKYIPIEWHSDIHQLVDSKMNKSTLNTVPKVRLATNDWLMDCLYYFSRPHGQYIIDSVCKQCNEAYLEYTTEYPDFHGHVHFIGFSLGGIIAYDIASMQWFEELDGLPPWQNIVLEELACQTPDFIVPRLEFKIRNIFTCGSPIAAGLVCRGLDYMHYRPPPRTKVFNIFHPFDPLGYRLEPMINADYISVDPVPIHRLKRLPKIPNLGIKSSFARSKPLLQSFWHYVSSTVVSSSTSASMSSKTTTTTTTTTLEADHSVQIQTPPSAPVSEEDEAEQAEYEEEIVQEIMIGMKRKTTSPTLQHKRRKSSSSPYSSSDSPSSSSSSSSSSATTTPNQSDDEQQPQVQVVVEEQDDVFVSTRHHSSVTNSEIEGKDGQSYPRTDYVLSENIIDNYASEWIVALKSHFRYWANRDLTLHIIKVFLDDRPLIN